MELSNVFCFCFLTVNCVIWLEKTTQVHLNHIVFFFYTMRSDSSRSSTRFKEPKFHTTLQSVSVCTGADSRLEIKNYWQLLQISGQAVCSDRKCCRFLVDLECFETVIDFCWWGNVHKWRKSMFLVLELLLFTFTYLFSICLHFFSEPVHGRVTAGLAPPLNT